MTDIIDRIDAVTAPVCVTCPATLDPDGPSPDFCSEDCQDRWHDARTNSHQLQRMMENLRPALETVAAAMREISRACNSVVSVITDLRKAQGLPPIPTGDVRERALAARRNRNTGPTQQRRAPRRIDKGAW